VAGGRKWRGLAADLKRKQVRGSSDTKSLISWYNRWPSGNKEWKV
jgi:hypothetical protein